VLGVWFMTQPRPTPSGSGAMTGEWTGARWTARVTQLAWVLGIPMAVWGANEIAEFNVNGTAPDPLANAAVVTGMLLWLVGFFGLGAVALYMARLADWAMDTGLSERLRLVSYAIGIGGFLLAFLVLLRGPIGYQGGGLATMFMGGLGLLLLLIAITQFAMAVFSFANLARWSASSRRAKIDSAARRSRRILERVEGGLAKPESTAASAHHAGQARVQGKVIERSGESNPYDLA
jgi:phosphotransferase system  glucose/maltose/N-acetylglucosamine-specific IIC component